MKKILTKHEILKLISNLLFGIFIIELVYIRVIKFSTFFIPFFKKLYGQQQQNEKNETVAFKINKWLWIIAGPVVLLMGYYWSFKALFKFIEAITHLTKSPKMIQ